MKAVILAGGKGTRLGELTSTIPKPMVEIGGKPLLAHTLGLLREYGVTTVFVTTGYLSDIIEVFCASHDFGMEVICIKEVSPLGTAGGVAALKEQLTEAFLVLYGDLFLDVNLGDFYQFHVDKHCFATLFAHPNDHPWDSDLLAVDGKQRITAIHKKPHAEQFANMSNAALYVLSPEVFSYIPTGMPVDFMHDIFPAAVQQGALFYAYNSAEYIKDMGTPERLAMVERAIVSGKVARLSTRAKRRAVFIDRDGTLIESVDQLHRLEDVKLVDGAAAAIRRLNAAGVLTILVTNQSVIARNLCTIQELEKIHNRMEWLLADAGGGYLDAIYYCPHHPDSGYPEENTAYKISCDCRKPATGMLKAAREQFAIDMGASWMIGDSAVDIQTGQNMGLGTLLVLTGQGEGAQQRAAADIIAQDLGQGVDMIISRMEW